MTCLVLEFRRLLETEAARLGSQRITTRDCGKMQAEYELMRAAITECRVIALLDHDKAMLTVLYEAAGNPVLVSMIQTLWQHCRAYKIVVPGDRWMLPGMTPCGGISRT